MLSRQKPMSVVQDGCMLVQGHPKHLLCSKQDCFYGMGGLAPRASQSMSFNHLPSEYTLSFTRKSM